MMGVTKYGGKDSEMMDVARVASENIVCIVAQSSSVVTDMSQDGQTKKILHPFCATLKLVRICGMHQSA
jgi:hypothetical protein